MSIAFNQAEDTIKVVITQDLVREEIEVVVPGAETELLVVNTTSGLAFFSDTTGKGEAGMPLTESLVAVTSNPGTVYLTCFGTGAVYITPGASA